MESRSRNNMASGLGHQQISAGFSSTTWGQRGKCISSRSAKLPFGACAASRCKKAVPCTSPLIEQHVQQQTQKQQGRRR